MTTSEIPCNIYQLRVVLRGISPLIWRRLLVCSETTLAQLHTILQVVFAWSDEHLHSFHIHGREYGSSGASTRGVLLRDLGLHRGERFRYVYDFGATGSVISVSKRSCLWHCDGSIRCVSEANEQRPRRTAGAPGAIWSGLISSACIRRWRRWG